MAKKKTRINVTETNYVYIDGRTGDRLTKEEFDRRYKQSGVGQANAQKRGRP